ncbi:MAG: hypothetical protein II945_07300 [Bacteroidales bacterium]|nr:hypothetical protein [Bacteroidales bacterium]
MMEDNKFRGRYRIPSARAQWHNYDGGEYFVTIYTRDREHYFGEIAGGKMHLSEMGMVADKCMRDIHNHFPHVDVPSYVIMPNHVHAIIVIDRTKMGIPIVEPQNFAALQSSQQSESLQKFGPQRRNLASVVRGFKIGVTKYARQNNITFAWQTRFHDHIIRNQDEMDNIARYIENNVAKWESDERNH